VGFGQSFKKAMGFMTLHPSDTTKKAGALTGGGVRVSIYQLKLQPREKRAYSQKED